MKVYPGAVILEIVLDNDFESIAPVRGQNGSWILSVNQKAGPVAMPVRIAGAIRDFEVICHCCASDRMFLVKVSSDTEAITPACTCQRSILACTVSRLDRGLMTNVQR